MRRTLAAMAVAGLLAAWLVTGGCATGRKRTLADLKGHIARKPKYWADYDRRKPLEDKIYAATPELLDLLDLDNELNGYREHPKAVALEADFVKDFREALLELPEPLRKRINQRFLGFFFMKELGGSAYTDVSFKEDGDTPDGIFMMLDVTALNRKANEWMTWKESSPFQAEADFSLEGVIEKPELDTRRNAIQYILLHEMGHIYSVDTRAHPLWTRKMSEISTLDGYDYINFAWKLDVKRGRKDGPPNTRYMTIFEDVFPRRRQVAYYSLSKSELRMSKAEETYLQLWRTNLPTLYGAGNPYDDFAELFVQYVHSVLLKKPWAIRLKQGDKVLLEQEACVLLPRCEAKRRVLEKYLREDGILPRDQSAYAFAR
jgi:hypothetical protein